MNERQILEKLRKTEREFSDYQRINMEYMELLITVIERNNVKFTPDEEQKQLQIIRELQTLLAKMRED